VDRVLLGQVKATMCGRLLVWVTLYSTGGVGMTEVLALENFETFVHIELH